MMNTCNFWILIVMTSCMSYNNGFSLAGLTHKNHQVDIETFTSDWETDSTSNFKLLQDN